MQPPHPISQRRKPRPRDRKWLGWWLPARSTLPAVSHPVLVRILQGWQATLHVGKHAQSSQPVPLVFSAFRTGETGRSLPLQVPVASPVKQGDATIQCLDNPLSSSKSEARFKE